MSDDLDEKPTLGEVFRGLGRLERTVDAGFETVNDQIKSLRQEFVSKELYESETKQLREQIESVSDHHRFLWSMAISLLAASGAFGSLFIHLH